MTGGFGLLALQAAAFWPVWPWLLARSFDASDEGQGWLAMLALGALALRSPPAPGHQPNLRAAAGLTALYALAVPVAPPLLRALIATLALAATLLALTPGLRPRLPALVLVGLALPILPSLQFVLGYPLRVASGELAALALRASGLAVLREGTLLAWKGKLVMIDAPCSGAAMLWAAVFLAATLAGLARLGEIPSAGLLLLSLVATVAANALRAALAFLIEAPVLPSPAGAHDALGIAVFAALAGSIVLASRALAKDAP